MAYVERSDEELISALEVRLKQVGPTPGRIGVASRSYTWEEFVEAMRRGEPFAHRFLESIREDAREGDKDPLKEIRRWKFYGSSSPDA